MSFSLDFRLPAGALRPGVKYGVSFQTFKSHVLMFLCFHVLMFSCSYILMFSSSHVFMFSCFHFIFRFPDFNFRSYFQRRIRKPKLIFSILDDLNSPPISTLSPFLLHEKYKFCQIKDHCVQIQLRIFSILNSAQG